MIDYDDDYDYIDVDEIWERVVDRARRVCSPALADAVDDLFEAAGLPWSRSTSTTTKTPGPGQLAVDEALRRLEALLIGGRA